jgi:hypothetical protein
VTQPTPEPATAELTVESAPESLDMSMRADANVNWANPDAVTRDQLIRINGLNAALSLRNSDFSSTGVPELLDKAAVIAAWITDGTTP